MPNPRRPGRWHLSSPSARGKHRGGQESDRAGAAGPCAVRGQARRPGGGGVGGLGQRASEPTGSPENTMPRRWVAPGEAEAKKYVPTSLLEGLPPTPERISFKGKARRPAGRLWGSQGEVKGARVWGSSSENGLNRRSISKIKRYLLVDNVGCERKREVRMTPRSSILNLKTKYSQRAKYCEYT